MEDYKRQRTGMPAITFTGDLIASSGGQYQNGVEQNRWHEIELFKTDSGNYVLTIGYRTLWAGESDFDKAFILRKPEEVLEELQSYDPWEHFAQHRTYNDEQVEKQERLLLNLRRHLALQITNIVAGDEFAVAIN